MIWWFGAAVFFAGISLWKKRFAYVLIGLLSAVNTYMQTPSADIESQRKLDFSGIVSAEHVYESYTKLHIHVDKLFQRTGEARIFIPAEFYTYRPGTYLGKRLQITGHLDSPMYAHRPFVLRGSIASISHDSTSPWKPVSLLREWIHRNIHHLLREDHVALGLSLILGGSGRLSDNLHDVFSRAGVLHILAVSGLHVGFIALFISILLFFLPIPREYKLLLTICVLFFYAAVAGFRPSVCRAVLMFFLFGLAVILQRNVSSIHIVNVSAIILLLAQPLLLFDIGAQLSFAAVYGIFYFYPIIKKRYHPRHNKYLRRYVVTPMTISFSAQLFVSPLLLYYFGRLPILAPLSNIIVVPLAAISIFLLFSSLFSALVWNTLAHMIARGASFVLTALIMTTRVFAAIPFSTIMFSVPPLFVALFYLLFVKCIRRFIIYTVLLLAILYSLPSLGRFIMISHTQAGTLIMTVNNTNFLILPKYAKMHTISQISPEQRIDNITYLIAPRDYYKVQKKFIDVSDNLSVKKIYYDDITIMMKDSMYIHYDNTQITLPFVAVQEQKVAVILTNGRKLFRITAPLYRSMIDQIALDTQLLFYKLICLF